MGVFFCFFFLGLTVGQGRGNPESFPQFLGCLWNVGGFMANGMLPLTFFFMLLAIW